MGGNAIKSVELVRLTKSEYKPYENLVISKLSKYINIDDIKTISYYKNKLDFGDMDLIIRKPKPVNLVQILKDEFNSKEVYVNSDVISFEFNNFQVDLIFTSSENLETSLFYFSYNDLNNFVGRFSHKFNLKFGHDGLSYIHRNKHESSVGKIYLTKEPRKIYEFLGYDYDRYLQGFNEIEDIFEYVCSSKYFSAEAFKYENLNHNNRTRNRKRKTYINFLDWLSESKYKNVDYKFTKEKDYYLPMIVSFFTESNLVNKISDFKEKEERLLKIKNKFSGYIIMKIIPTLEGKMLGYFITKFKEQFQNEETYFNYIENIEERELEKDIKNLYNEEFNRF